MPDLSLSFSPEIFGFDLALISAGDTIDIQGDDGLLTAVIISLFTDRRANEDDPLPDERIGVPSDRRGWWGDTITEEEARDPIGSRLWLLSREKDQALVVARAQQYADEALAWLTRDHHVARLSVTAARVSPGYLGIDVRILPLPGTGTDDRDWAWNFLYDYANAGPVIMRTPGMV
jgi:phage gp46-like protein